MLKAIKIRIYPNNEQVAYINKQLGCCRFVYNQCLSYRRTTYDMDKKSISSTQTINHIVCLKKDFSFLKEVHSKVLQQSVIDLNKSFDNFFKKISNYPKFKSKKDNHQSCRFPKDAFIGIRGNRIDLIKTLRDIHFKCSRKDEFYINKHKDNVKSLTLTKTSSGKYYISILIDGNLNRVTKETNNTIGIDLGVKNFVITSDGNVFENFHFKKTQSQKIQRLQRNISKKQKGSNNRNKARIKLAKLFEKINNKKRHYLHQISNTLIDENQIICMEDLNVRGMIKNHNLVDSIQEMNFGEFRRMLEYKAAWYNRKLVFINRFYPSSKTCHNCGYVNKKLTLYQRQWICPQCGQIIERDYNAALNILDEGLKIIGLSSPEFKLADYPTMDDKLRNKELKSSDRLKQENNVFH